MIVKSNRNSLLALLRDSLRDSSASTLPIAAIVMLLLIGVVGGAVDMSRIYSAQTRLQAACDSGVLAGRRAVTTNGYDQTAQTQATTYFNTNYIASAQGSNSTTFNTSSSNAGNTVTGTASTNVGMVFMQMFGWSQLTLNATCSSTMGVGNSDIMMVLDVTGSMDSTLGSGTRISALRTAMKNFYTTLATATQGSNARIRYGFVPFSSAVNVGQVIYDKDPSYLANSWPVQSREPIFNTITEQQFQGWDTAVYTSSQGYSTETTTSLTLYSNQGYSSQSACTTALPANGAYANNGTATTSTSTTVNGSGQQVVTTTTAQPQTKRSYTCYKPYTTYYVYYYNTNRTYYTYSYATSDPIYQTVTRQVFDHWDYKQLTLDTSVFKTFANVSVNNGSSGTPVTYNWDGCIEERSTVSEDTFSYNSILGIRPSGANDLDIDSAPTSSATSKWGPMWPEMSYYRRDAYNNITTAPVTTNGRQASSYCPPAARQLATISQSTFNAYADSLSANGNTYLDIGMLWGARFLSPDGVWQNLVNTAPANGGNVARHIIFMTDGEMSTNNMLLTTYGLEYLDRRVTDDGSNSQSDSRHSSRFRALCDAVKAKGIRIWAIGFTSGLTSDLAYCASTNSAYTADTSTQLNDAFQSIARQVGELRVLS